MKNTMKTIGLAALAAMTLTACGGGGGASEETGDILVESHPYDAPPISEADKNAYLNAVNEARATGRTCGKYGFFEAVPALVWNDGLYKAAYEHSQDMASTGVLTHSGSGGESDWTAQVLNLGRASTMTDRIENNIEVRRKEYSYGENAAKGASSLSSVMKGWLASDGHCTAIMSPYYQEIGVARVGGYWTQNFRGKF